MGPPPQARPLPRSLNTAVLAAFTHPPTHLSVPKCHNSVSCLYSQAFLWSYIKSCLVYTQPNVPPQAQKVPFSLSPPPPHSSPHHRACSPVITYMLVSRTRGASPERLIVLPLRPAPQGSAWHWCMLSKRAACDGVRAVQGCLAEGSDGLG